LGEFLVARASKIARANKIVAVTTSEGFGQLQY